MHYLLFTIISLFTLLITTNVHAQLDSSSQKIALSQLDLSLMEQGWGKPGINVSVEGKPLIIKGQKFTSGVGTHAKSEAIILLNGTGTRFQSHIGINDLGGNEAGKVEFIVYGDEKVLYRSGTMNKGDVAKKIDIDIRKVQQMKLVVDPLGNNASDHANWAEAFISYSGAAPTLFDPSAEFVPSKFYPLSSQRTVASKGASFYVDPARGSDENSGTSLQSPWKTLARLNQVSFVPGSKIYLFPGKYEHTFYPTGNGTVESPIKVTFAAGEYDFYQGVALSRKFQISNTNDAPKKAKPIILSFENVKNYILEGDKDSKTDIFVNGKMIHCAITHSENISINHLCFDFRRPTMSEYQVVAVNENSVDVRIHDDSKYRIHNNKLIWVGDGWELTAPQFTQEGNVASQTLFRAQSLFANAAKIEELEKNLVRITFNKKRNVKLHNIFQERNTHREMVGAFTANSKNVSYVNCAFYFMHGLGIVNQFTENITLKNIWFAPRVNSGRTASCWADAIQASSCKGLLLIEDCMFSGTHDDPLNVHGTALRIISKKSSNVIIARFMHGQTFGFQPFFPNDEIEFVSNTSMTPYHKNKVVSVQKLNEREFELTLENEAAAFEKNHVLDNLTWYPEVVIKNCVINMCSTRGFLLTSMKPILVEKCLFTRTFMPAILVEGDANGWFESGRIRNMVLRDNIFMECAEPVIQINPGTRTNKPGERVEKNILIENNTFKLKGNTAVSAKSVDGLRIINNIFSTPKLPVRTNACDNVTIENNQLQQ